MNAERWLPCGIAVAAGAGALVLALALLDVGRDELSSGPEVETSAPRRAEPGRAAPVPVVSAAVPARSIEVVRGRRSDPPDRAARPGSERWHEARLRELAARAPDEFAGQAGSRVAAGSTRGECMAWLRIADEFDRDLADSLYASVLDRARDDARLRDGIVTRLIALAPSCERSRARLLDLVVRDERMPSGVRGRAESALRTRIRPDPRASADPADPANLEE